MQTKLFEVRDRATFIPVLAVLMQSYTPEENYLLGRSGYSNELPQIILMSINGERGSFQCCPEDWASRTLSVAHDYIRKKWYYLGSGNVIDVEFILGETKIPKVSERWDT